VAIQPKGYLEIIARTNAYIHSMRKLGATFCDILGNELFPVTEVLPTTFPMVRVTLAEQDGLIVMYERQFDKPYVVYLGKR